MSESTVSESGHSAFRMSEKYFKSRAPHPGIATSLIRRRVRKGKDPSLTYPLLQGQGVLDLSRPVEGGKEDEVRRAGWKTDDDPFAGRPARKIKVSKPGPESVETLDGYIVGDGLLLIPGYLNESEQLDLVRSSLSEYTRPPNPLSLSTHYVLPTRSDQPSLFDLYAHEPETEIPSIASKLLASDSPEPSPTPSSSSSAKRQLIQNEAANEEGYQSIVDRVSGWKGDEPSLKLKSKTARKLVETELRWANLGWVYNWTNKAYDFTSSAPIPFPVPLGETCRNIVRGIPWDEVFGNIDDVCGEGYEEGGRIRPEGYDGWKDDYTPDTGIVNFYQTRDTLMGHVDRSELDPYRPLISISLGHAGVFLLGGTTRQTPPIPIVLRSGDVLVMAGRGRKCYHGIPRIMEGTLPDHLKLDEAADEDQTTRACKRFIANARININARQVFPNGFQLGPGGKTLE